MIKIYYNKDTIYRILLATNDQCTKKKMRQISSLHNLYLNKFV